MIQDDTRWYKRIQDVTICYQMLQDVTRLFRTSQVRPFFCLVRQYRLVLKSVWRESFHKWEWLDTGFFLEASWRESISRRITLVECDVKEKFKTGCFFNWSASKMTITMLTIFLLKTLKPFLWQVLDLGKMENSNSLSDASSIFVASNWQWQKITKHWKVNLWPR